MSYYTVITEDWYGGNTGGPATLTEREKEVAEEVCGDANTEIKVFEDLNEAKAYHDLLINKYNGNKEVIIVKQTSEYLINKEKEISELKEMIRKQEETIKSQERTITKLYYSPGAPGVLESKEEFIQLASFNTDKY